MEAILLHTAHNSWGLFPSDWPPVNVWNRYAVTPPSFSPRLSPAEHFSLSWRAMKLMQHVANIPCLTGHMIVSIHAHTYTQSERVGRWSCSRNKDNCGLTSYFFVDHFGHREVRWNLPQCHWHWQCVTHTHTYTHQPPEWPAAQFCNGHLRPKRWTKSRGYQESKPSKTESNYFITLAQLSTWFPMDN